MFNKVTENELLSFTKHLHMMLVSGIPISEAVEALGKHAKSSPLKKATHDIVSQVSAGKSFSQSLKKYPNVFPSLYTSMIKVGEASGTLEEALDYLSRHYQKQIILKQKIASALVYPAIVIAAVIAMTSFITFYVLPQLLVFFEALEVDLPTSTKILLAIATYSKNYGLITGLLAIVTVFSLGLIIKTAPGKAVFDALQLKIPVLGNLIRDYYLALITNNLSTLIQNGVPILQSLEITQDSINHYVYQKILSQLASGVSSGKSLETILTKVTSESAFPDYVSKIISVGSQTGKIEISLSNISSFYSDEIDNASKTITTVIEPLLLLIIGLVVGFVAIAILSPIYELNTSIRN
jgi:type II secretory pathway component PulF